MSGRAGFVLIAGLVACVEPSGKGGGGDRDGGGATVPGGGVEQPKGDVPQVWINEVMTQNQATWQDEAGSFPDWIELWNPNDAPVDLSGWWMSDDGSDPFDWEIPDGVVIEAGEYLVVACDDDAIDGGLHASFHLASEGGEDVVLFGPDTAGNPKVDTVEDLEALLPDQSLARLPDGGATWDFAGAPTPGASNGQ